MTPEPPPGQGPIDPRGAFSSPPPPPPQSHASGSGGQPQHAARPMFPQMMQPMPSPMPPPYYPPPPSRGGGVMRTLLSVFLVLGFLGSVVLNLILLIVLAAGGGGTAGAANANVIVDGDPNQLVAVVPVSGEISSVTADRFDAVIKNLEKRNNIKSLVIAIDTPGGEMTASDRIYERILRFKKEKNVKVVAQMGSMATSGGYYVACAADHVVAMPTTLTGNIGVIWQRFNFSELMDKYGVEDTSVTPPDSKYKIVGSPFRPEDPEAAAYLTGLVEHGYERFKKIVKDGRGSKLTDKIDSIADGRVLNPDQAMKLGLIDQIGYANDAYAKAASLAGLTRQHVVEFKPREPGLLELLMGPMGSAGSLGNVGTKGDVSLRIDRQAIHEFTTPRMMMIYRGQ